MTPKLEHWILNIEYWLLSIARPTLNIERRTLNVGRWLFLFSLLLAPLGRLDAVHTEISVIEITVDLEKFTEGPAAKLSEPTDPAFYELNKRELESIDLARIGRAVQRLADAPPRLYRSDITRRMIALISEPGVTFHDTLCRALIQWSDEPGPAGEAVLPVMRNLIST